MPLILAALILFGLLSALLGTGMWHVFSWLALGVPAGILVRYIGFRPRAGSRAR